MPALSQPPPRTRRAATRQHIYAHDDGDDTRALGLRIGPHEDADDDSAWALGLRTGPHDVDDDSDDDTGPVWGGARQAVIVGVIGHYTRLVRPPYSATSEAV